MFLVVFFLAIGMNAQNTTMTRLVEVWKGTCGSKNKAVPSELNTKAGGKVYDSLFVDIPYGECPSHDILDSTGIRYGDHIIYIQAQNDSVAKNKPDSVYVEAYLVFMTPEGRIVNTGYVLQKGWISSGAATNSIDPENTTFATYMMCQYYAKANLYVKIYTGYPKTPSLIRVWKQYKPRR